MIRIMILFQDFPASSRRLLIRMFLGRPHGDHQTTKKEVQESQAKQEMTFR
jgi:hypothetical protein